MKVFRRGLFLGLCIFTVRPTSCTGTCGDGSEPCEAPYSTDEYKTNSDSDLLQAIQKLLDAERRRQARIHRDEADAANNGPKEINIFCPSAPQVTITDLPQSSRLDNECLVLNINAPDLSSRLVLKCDGDVDQEEQFGEDW